MPESCVLILIGLLVGFLVYYVLDYYVGTSHEHFPKFTAALFFNVLLPPIILGKWEGS
jgi:CRISPR/Cas system-associated protein Csm6